MTDQILVTDAPQAEPEPESGVDAMKPFVAIHTSDGIGRISMARPPANVLSDPMRSALYAAINMLDTDPKVQAIVLGAQGRQFSKGIRLEHLETELASARADASGSGEFDPAPGDAPSMAALCARIGACRKPVVAALAGLAMGEGAALALAAHARVMGPRARLVFSDVSLGLVPTGGATQRLPRLIGTASALEVLINGGIVDPARAETLGLSEIAAAGEVSDAARDMAQNLAAAPDTWQGWPDEGQGLGAWDEMAQAIATARKTHLSKDRPVVAQIIACVEAASLLPYAAGVAREGIARADCFAKPQSAALRYLLQAERSVARPPETSPPPKPRGDAAVFGICGAGHMPLALALTALDAEVEVVYCVPDRAALTETAAKIKAAYGAATQRGLLTEDVTKARLARLKLTHIPADLAGCDLVVEATTGENAARFAAFKDVEAALPKDVALATVSDHGLAEMAATLAHPTRFCAAHFMTPVQQVRVVELATHDGADAAAIARAHMMLKRIGKLPVMVAGRDALIANKLHLAGLAAVDVLLLMGATPQQIDSALVGFGYAQGPCAKMDQLGLHVFPGTVARMLASSKLEGFFAPGGTDAAAVAIIDQMRAAADIAPRQINAAEIVGRVILAQANAGAALLSEGVVSSAQAIDATMVLAKGFPRVQGGPMHWADRLTPLQARKALAHYASAAPDIWAPDPMWDKLIRSGGRFTES